MQSGLHKQTESEKRWVKKSEEKDEEIVKENVA